MAKRAKQRAVVRDQKLKRNLILISLAVLLVKFVLILSIKSGGWLGADGESYLYGVDALIKSGFASKDIQLIYWPAGYPLIIWMLTFISMSKVIYLISFTQSILYFVATTFFVERIRLTRLSKLAIPLALILGLNPTLSLSSLAIGYESAVASCYLLIVALILRFRQNKTKQNLVKTVLLVGFIQGVSSFIQPTGMLLGTVILILWGIFNGGWKNFVTIVLIGTSVIMIFPSVLVLRNIQANGTVALNNSLGGTMNGGAGDKASGAVPRRKGTYGVPCSPKPPATVATDSQLIRCVIKWYLTHPAKTAVLAVKKSVYFWSPWYGPLANGTMARNPWLKIDPIRNIDTTKAGHDLVYGWFGYVISWIWFTLNLFLVFYGFRWLWRLGGVEKELSILAGTPIILAWLISIGTFGDHRYRLPSMGLSLFLQVAGYFGLRERLAGGAGRSSLEPRGRAR